MARVTLSIDVVLFHVVNMIEAGETTSSDVHFSHKMALNCIRLAMLFMSEINSR